MRLSSPARGPKGFWTAFHLLLCKETYALIGGFHGLGTKIHRLWRFSHEPGIPQHAYGHSRYCELSNKLPNIIRLGP